MTFSFSLSAIAVDCVWQKLLTHQAHSELNPSTLTGLGQHRRLVAPTHDPLCPDGCGSQQLASVAYPPSTRTEYPHRLNEFPRSKVAASVSVSLCTNGRSCPPGGLTGWRSNSVVDPLDGLLIGPFQCDFSLLVLERLPWAIITTS